MKRSLISLAAMAAVGAASAQRGVTLFGRADLTAPEPPRLLPLPSETFWLGVDYGAAADVIVAAFVPAHRFGKTASLGPRGGEDLGEPLVRTQEARPTLKLHPWQEELISKLRKQRVCSYPWLPIG